MTRIKSPEKNVIYGFRYGINNVKAFAYIKTLPNGRLEFYDVKGKYKTTMLPARFSWLYSKALEYETPLNQQLEIEIKNNTARLAPIASAPPAKRESVITPKALVNDVIKRLFRLSEADKQRFLKSAGRTVESLINDLYRVSGETGLGLLNRYKTALATCNIIM